MAEPYSARDAEPLVFADRAALRAWLGSPATPREGVWLVFGKPGGPTTVSAAEALEEALCHGWIDGQMRRVDDHSYVKYLAPRRRGSVWSARNRALVDRLIAENRMTQAGLDAVAAAKADGSWESAVRAAPTEEQVEELGRLVSGHASGYAGWLRMPPSARRTYTAHYLDAKSEATRVRRLEQILDRLDRGLTPM